MSCAHLTRGSRIYLITRSRRIILMCLTLMAAGCGYIIWTKARPMQRPFLRFMESRHGPIYIAA
jgi:hypothetical protein